MSYEIELEPQCEETTTLFFGESPVVTFRCGLVQGHEPYDRDRLPTDAPLIEIGAHAAFDEEDNELANWNSGVNFHATLQASDGATHAVESPREPT